MKEKSLLNTVFWTSAVYLDYVLNKNIFRGLLQMVCESAFYFTRNYRISSKWWQHEYFSLTIW